MTIHSGIWYGENLRVMSRAAVAGLSILCLFGVGQVSASKTSPHQAYTAQIPFLENRGQVDEQVAYYAQTFAGQVYVTHDGQIVTVVHGKAPVGEANRSSGVAIWETLGSIPSAGVWGSSPSEVQVKYLASADDVGHPIEVPGFEWVELGEIESGIHSRMRCRGNNVERFFYVQPGADPNQLKVSLRGVEALSVTDGGELVLHTKLGDIYYSAPIAWQIIEGARVEVDVRYSVLQAQKHTNDYATYGFTLGSYDNNHELIIDPLIAATLLGGSQQDRAVAVAVDGTSVFVAGHTLSLDFPTTAGVFDPINSGGALGQPFVSRFDLGLTELQASTFFGIGQVANPHATHAAMAIKAHNGDVVLAYQTESSQNPVLGSSFDATLGGDTDVFVAKLSADLSTLIGSTFLGGSGKEYLGGMDIATTNGNICVGGSTESSNFPVTAGSHDTTLGGVRDGFVTCLNGGLSSLVASSYIGTANTDSITAIRTIGSAVAAGGSTNSPSTFPTPNGAFQTPAGGIDGFVALFSSSMQLVSATLLGGIGNDQVNVVEAHGGSVYAAGTISGSTGFPTMMGDDSSHNGGADIFVARFNGLLGVLESGTFLGGAQDDRLADLVFDSNGTGYVLGISDSTDFPTTSDAFQADPFENPESLVLAAFNASLSSLQYSSYLRSVFMNDGTLPSMATESPDVVLVPGLTRPAGYVVTENAYQTQPLGGSTANTTIIRMWLNGAISQVSMGFTAIDFPEDNGILSIEVSRAGSPLGYVEVYWHTTDGTAIEGIDYVGEGGVLRWQQGDTEAQSIDIPIIANDVDDGIRSFSVSLASPAGATIAPFGGGRQINILDNDAAGISVDGPVPSSSLREIPDSASISVQLDSQPAASTVTVSALSTDTTAGVLQGATGGLVELIFNQTNWNLPQNIIVNSVDDDIDDGDQLFDLAFLQSQSADPNYDGITLPPVNLVTVDDDESGFFFEPMSPPLTTSEDGTTDTFMIRLASEPLATVILDVMPDADGADEGDLAPPNMTFIASAWDVFQQVTVTGLDDMDIDGDVLWQVILSGTSNDPNYSISTTGGPLIVNLDNDAVPVNLAVNVSNGLGSLPPFVPLTYSIQVSNLTTTPVNGTLVTTSALNLDMANATWTCSPSGLSLCSAPSGTGPISTLVDIDSQSGVEFLVQTSALNMPGEFAELSAVVTVPIGTTDIDPSDNFDVDSDIIFVFVIFKDGLEALIP